MLVLICLGAACILTWAASKNIAKRDGLDISDLEILAVSAILVAVILH